MNDWEYAQKVTYWRLRREQELATALTELRRLVGPTIKNSAKTLDYGCNTGTMMLELATRFVNWTFVGADINKAAIVRARAQYQGMGMHFVHLQDEYGFLPFDHQTFDFVFAFHTLPHTPNPWLALSEITRCLKEGGYLIIVNPNPAHTKLVRPWRKLTGRWKPDSTIKFRYSRAWYEEALRFKAHDIVLSEEMGLRLFPTLNMGPKDHFLIISRRNAVERECGLPVPDLDRPSSDLDART